MKVWSRHAGKEEARERGHERMDEEEKLIREGKRGRPTT
jgi:hypothetical protein